MKIPAYYLLLDFVGTLLIGVGLAECFAGLQLVPAPLRVDNYSLHMIVIGIVLLIPMVTWIIRHASANNR